MPRTGENIYKRKDGRWEGRYIKARDQSGKAIYGYVYAKTYRDVKQRLSQAIALTPIHLGSASKSNSPLFEDIAQEWFETNKAQFKVSTQNKYLNLLDSYILPEYGHRYLSRLTDNEIEHYCNSLLSTGGKRGEGLSTKTVSDMLSVIRCILKFARSRGYLFSCTAQTVSNRKATQEMRVLSRSEQDKLCKYLYSYLDLPNLGILLCLFTGLRIGELCALRWEDSPCRTHNDQPHQ